MIPTHGVDEMKGTFELDDRDLIDHDLDYYLKQINSNNALLMEISKAGLEKFLEDEFYFSAGCFLLQGSVGSCINLGIHIVTAHGLQKPPDHHTIFDMLISCKVIPSDLGPKLKSLISIRDRLVNLDPELDPLTVFGAIRHNLSDILAFQKHVVKWLQPTQ